jgi:hypothetical protein
MTGQRGKKTSYPAAASCRSLVPDPPRALPWAGMSRPVGACVDGGASYPGRCPGLVYHAPLGLSSPRGGAYRNSITSATGQRQERNIPCGSQPPLSARGYFPAGRFRLVNFPAWDIFSGYSAVVPAGHYCRIPAWHNGCKSQVSRNCSATRVSITTPQLSAAFSHRF